MYKHTAKVVIKIEQVFSVGAFNRDPTSITTLEHCHLVNAVFLVYVNSQRLYHYLVG